MAFIFSDSPPFAFGSQFPVLSFQFPARTLLVQNDYKVARSGAKGHAIQCGQSLNLLNWRYSKTREKRGVRKGSSRRGSAHPENAEGVPGDSAVLPREQSRESHYDHALDGEVGCREV